MTAQQLKDSLNACLSAMKSKHQEKGYKRFIYDGAVDAAKYVAAPVKVCFLLKECYVSIAANKKDRNDIEDHKTWLRKGHHPLGYPQGHHWVKYICDPNEENDDCTYSLVKNLHKEAPWAKMWNAVAHMAGEILGAEEAGISPSHAVQHIAVVNLKKSNGVSTSTEKDIIRYAKDDREYLLEELTLLAPDIIVCGGTFDLCKAAHIFPDDLRLICTYKKRSGLRAAWRWGETIILDTWHPSAPGLGYDRFTSAYRQHAGLLRKESGIS